MPASNLAGHAVRIADSPAREGFGDHPDEQRDVTNPPIGFHGHPDTVASAGDDLAFVYGDVLTCTATY